MFKEVIKDLRRKCNARSHIFGEREEKKKNTKNNKIFLSTRIAIQIQFTRTN